MKKVLLLLFLFPSMLLGQGGTTTQNIRINRLGATLYLNGYTGGIDFYNGDLTLRQSSNKLTLFGGDFDLGTNSLLGTGSIGATGSRILKGWFTDLELDNLPTVMGVPLISVADSTTGDGHYASDHRMDVAEYDLSHTATLPQPGADGFLMTSFQGLWEAKAPAPGGAGGGGGVLRFITGVTSGAPVNGDSVLTSTLLINKRLRIDRGANGGMLYGQYRNPTGTPQANNLGYRFQKATGEVVFNPPLATNEKVVIEVTDSTAWTELAFAGPSTLLTGLHTAYDLDETTGNAIDLKAVVNLPVSGALPNQSGKIGTSYYFDGVNDYIGGVDTYFEYTGSFTLAAWVKKYDNNLAMIMSNTTWPYGFIMQADQYFSAYVFDGVSVPPYAYVGSDAITTTWQHEAITWDGTYLRHYHNGVLIVTSEAFNHTPLYSAGARFYIGRLTESATTYMFKGWIDMVRTWNTRALSGAELLNLFNKEDSGITYPWN